MKTKLLKKIRKRFDWYWSSEANLIILDKEINRSYVVNETFAKQQGYLTDTYKPEDIKVPMQVFFSRIGLDYMSSKFNVGFSMEKKFYRRRKSIVDELREKGNVHYKLEKPKDESKDNPSLDKGSKGQ